MACILLNQLHMKSRTPGQELSRAKAVRYLRQDRSVLFSALVDSSTEAFLVLTEDGNIATWNKAAQRLLGFKAKEIRGRSLSSFLSLGSGNPTHCYLHRVLRGECSLSVEGKLRRRDGALLDTTLRLAKITDSKGVNLGISCMIAKPKPAREWLQKLASVVRQTADMVMITDKFGKIEYVNPAFETATGYKSEEVIGQSASILKSGQHLPSFYETLWKSVVRGEPFRATMINKKKDGSFFHTEKTITPLVGEKGEITHFVSTDKDVTEQREAELSARVAQQKFTDLFNFSPDPMAYCRVDGTVLEFNEAFASLLGFEKKELTGKNFFERDITAILRSDGNPHSRTLTLQGGARSYESEFTRRDGKKVSTLVTAFPVRGEYETNAIGLIIKDISVIKKQQEQLELLAQDLKRSNVELEHFASVASHDLQEPLRTMVTYLQLIEKKNESLLDARSSQHLKLVVDSSKRLYNLVSDLLAYARVGAGKFQLVEFETASVVEQVLCDLAETIRERGARIDVEHLPKICADRQRIAQVFQNLISNSLKYCTEAIPTIRISAETNTRGWTFHVRDNGIGIPPDSTTKIFELYQRLHTKKDFPGTGVGLALCKKIIEQHGGRIWVESIPGHGSRFSFSLASNQSFA